LFVGLITLSKRVRFGDAVTFHKPAVYMVTVSVSP
jgi:hypothetical protein